MSIYDDNVRLFKNSTHKELNNGDPKSPKNVGQMLNYTRKVLTKHSQELAKNKKKTDDTFEMLKGAHDGIVHSLARNGHIHPDVARNYAFDKKSMDDEEEPAHVNETELLKLRTGVHPDVLKKFLSNKTPKQIKDFKAKTSKLKKSYAKKADSAFSDHVTDHEFSDVDGYDSDSITSNSGKKYQNAAKKHDFHSNIDKALKSIKEDTFSQGTDTLQNEPHEQHDASHKAKLNQATTRLFRAHRGLVDATKNLETARNPGQKAKAESAYHAAKREHGHAKKEHSFLKGIKESYIVEDAIQRHPAYAQGVSVSKTFKSPQHAVAVSNKAFELHKKNAQDAQRHGSAKKSLEDQGKTGSGLHTYHSQKHARHTELADKYAAFSHGVYSRIA